MFDSWRVKRRVHRRAKCQCNSRLFQNGKLVCDRDERDDSDRVLSRSTNGRLAKVDVFRRGSVIKGTIRRVASRVSSSVREGQGRRHAEDLEYTFRYSWHRANAPSHRENRLSQKTSHEDNGPDTLFTAPSRAFWSSFAHFCRFRIYSYRSLTIIKRRRASG